MVRFKLGSWTVECDGQHVMVECVGKNHTWNPLDTFLCPWCEEAAGRVAEHIPKQMNRCLPCGRALEKGERHYFKQGDPGSTVCLVCGERMDLKKYKHWLVTECRPFHYWTDEEVSRGKPTGKFSAPICEKFCCKIPDKSELCRAVLRWDGGEIYCFKRLPCPNHSKSE